MGIGSHTRAYKGYSDVWLTPPEIIKELGPFDLDPCAAPAPRPWDTAKVHYDITQGQDGLALPWFGFVWLNPPYGQEGWAWLDKLSRHGNGIALMFARTETSGFVSEVWSKADALLFLFGRLYFYHPDGSRARGNSGGPSVLIAYGEEAKERLSRCRMDGAFVSQWEIRS